MGTASAVPILLVAAILGFAAPASARSTAQLEQSFFQAVNAVRVGHGLPPLLFDTRLRSTARSHTGDMIRRAYFAHRDYARRIASVGAPGNWVGEILGWVVDRDNSVQTIVRLWLESPTHRAVLLSSSARRVGIGVARGAFKGWPDVDVVTTDLQGWNGR